jgi:hypothetical protein
MFECDCYKIGGPFVGADPNCPTHGTQADERQKRIDKLRDQLEKLNLSGQLSDAVYYSLLELVSLIED